MAKKKTAKVTPNKNLTTRAANVGSLINAVDQVPMDPIQARSQKFEPGIKTSTSVYEAGIPSQSSTPVSASISANLGVKQQLDAAEQSQAVRNIQAAGQKAMQGKRSAAPAAPQSKQQADPPGTFRNADNELVVGDLKAFRKATVKRKK